MRKQPLHSSLPTLLERFAYSDTALENYGEADHLANVCSNLNALFNSHAVPSDETFRNYPDICDTVIGYGVKDPRAYLHARDYSEELLRAIRAFEPRLLSDKDTPVAVPVRLPENHPALCNPNRWYFEIAGELVMETYTRQVCILAMFDLDTGYAAVAPA